MHAFHLLSAFTIQKMYSEFSSGTTISLSSSTCLKVLLMSNVNAPVSEKKSFVPQFLLVLVIVFLTVAATLIATPRLMAPYAIPKNIRVLPDLEQAPENISPTAIASSNYNVSTVLSESKIKSFPQPSISIATNDYAPINSSSSSSINDALEKVVPFDISEGASLREFADSLGHTLNIPVRLDERVLAGELGLDVNEPGAIFHTAAINQSVRSSLSQMLSNVFETPLTFLNRHDVLLITDKQYAADNYLETWIYPLPFDEDRQSVIELIHQVIAPTTWNIVGGPGAIMPAGSTHGGLAISQTYEIHHEIEQFLRIREIALWVEHGKKNIKIYTVLDSSALRDLEKSLKEMCNSALGDLADESASVSIEQEKLIVQSSSRPFIVYAHQVISAYLGVLDQRSQYHGLPTDKNGVANGSSMSGGYF